MVPYRTISYHKPYQTIPNQIKPYQTKSNHTKWYQTFLNQTKPHCLIDPATWNAIQHLLGFNFRKVVTITCNLCPESSVVQMLINIYRQHNAQIICLRVQYWLERLYSKESQLEGEHQSVFGPIAECICPNCKLYLSHLQNVFVQKYFSKSQNHMYQSAVLAWTIIQ